MCAREGLTTYFTFMKKPINAKVLFEKEEENFLGGVYNPPASLSVELCTIFTIVLTFLDKYAHQ